MRTLIFLFTFLLTLAGNTSLEAQTDPAAEALLEKAYQKYTAQKSTEIDFKVTIQIPEQSPEILTGQFIKQGTAYLISMDDQVVYCDGKTVWIHVVKNKEVQINDADNMSQDNVMSPDQFLQMYKSDEYLYGITKKYSNNGKQLVDIEFKPVDSYNPNAKIRLTLNETTLEPISMYVFQRDGQRFQLDIDRIQHGQSYPITTFQFDSSAFPSITEIDLRF